MESAAINQESTTSRGAATGRRPYLFAFLTVAFGAAFALVIFEAGLRIVGYSSPEFYMADTVLGFSLIPSQSGTYSKEGRSFVQINSAGFRDLEREVAKPPGTVRVAVIGDSFVEALQVSLDDQFARHIENEIQKCGALGDGRVEVLSFGVSGYSTGQQLLMLRERVWQYSSDIVILVMTTNNDITDNSRYFKKTPIPYFVYEEGRLMLDTSFRQDRSFQWRNSNMGRVVVWLKNNLRFVQAFGQIQVALKYRYRAWNEQPAEPVAAPDADQVPVAELGIDSQIYRPPADANWDDAWKVTEGILELMKTEVESHGAKFVVVTGSNGVQVLPNVNERAAFAKLLGVDDLFYPDQRIAEFCEIRSIHNITLAPFLADVAARENVNLHGFEGNLGYGHWNEVGHKVAGSEIGRRLCEDVLH